MKKIAIIGAGGHGLVALDIARLNGYDDIKLLDDDTKNTRAYGTTELIKKLKLDHDFFVAIGDNGIRKKFFKKLKNENCRIVSLIHPSAVVSVNVEIGIGSIIMAGAVINTNAKIGNGCIINTSSSVDHESEVGDFTHIAVGAHLAGAVKISENTTIGAGAVVIKNIEKCGIYVGIPAKSK